MWHSVSEPWVLVRRLAEKSWRNSILSKKPCCPLNNLDIMKINEASWRHENGKPSVLIVGDFCWVFASGLCAIATPSSRSHMSHPFSSSAPNQSWEKKITENLIWSAFGLSYTSSTSFVASPTRTAVTFCVTAAHRFASVEATRPPVDGANDSNDQWPPPVAFLVDETQKKKLPRQQSFWRLNMFVWHLNMIWIHLASDKYRIWLSKEV